MQNAKPFLVAPILLVFVASAFASGVLSKICATERNFDGFPPKVADPFAYELQSLFGAMSCNRDIYACKVKASKVASNDKSPSTYGQATLTIEKTFFGTPRQEIVVPFMHENDKLNWSQYNSDEGWPNLGTLDKEAVLLCIVEPMPKDHDHGA